ncbi:hypothetical protein VTO42DRAFT_6087 [Malbranchea cinnamomea]
MTSNRFTKFPAYPQVQEMTSSSQMATEIDCLVEMYATISTLHPSLNAFSKKPEYFGLLVQVFKHHVRLIRSRPQELERGYVTVYDKALMKLTAGGHDLSHTGAIALFLEEILGVSTKDSVEDLEIFLKGNVALRSALLEGMPAPAEKYGMDLPGYLTGPSVIFLGIEAIKWREKDGHKSGTPSISGAPKETKFMQEQKERNHNPQDHIERLLLTFTNAQYEYSSTGEGDFARKRQTAKFLRDSAENALAYLQTSHPDHYMIPLLRRTFEMAQAKCIGLNGGRKRPFEMSPEEYYRRPRRHQEAREYRYGRADCYRP